MTTETSVPSYPYGSATKLIADWSTQHYTLLDNPISDDMFLAFAEYGRQVFAEIPEPILQELCYNAWPSDPESAAGPVIRRGANGRDYKNYFHWHDECPERYAKAQAMQWQCFRDFLQVGMQIYNAATALARDAILRPLADHRLFPDILERFMPGGKPSQFFLRLLFYKAAPGRPLANNHYDIGGFTLAFRESREGLMLGRGDDDLVPVAYRKGRVIAFPSYAMRDYTDGSRFGPFVPAWHGVAQNGEFQEGEEARWAVVFFCDAPGIKRANYGERDENGRPSDWRSHTPYSYLLQQKPK